MTEKRILKVAIIGAGMSGLCMAVKLQDLGKDGLAELFPWVPRRHRELLSTPEVADFDVRTA